MCVIIRKSRWLAFSFGEGGKKCSIRSNAFELEGKKKKADLNSLQKICSKLSESHSVTPAIERGQVWDP